DVLLAVGIAHSAQRLQNCGFGDHLRGHYTRSEATIPDDPSVRENGSAHFGVPRTQHDPCRPRQRRDIAAVTRGTSIASLSARRASPPEVFAIRCALPRARADLPGSALAARLRILHCQE